MMSHIFLFANLVDDRINEKSNLGGEGVFATAAIQILKDSFKKKIDYTLAGKIGTDASGYFLKSQLEKLGVDTSGLSNTDIPTCRAVIKGVRKAIFIGFEGGPVCNFTSEETNRFSKLLQSRGWIFLTSNSCYDNETWRQIEEILKSSPRLLFFDINWREALLKRSGIALNDFIHERLTPLFKKAHVIKGTQEELHRFRVPLTAAKPIWLLETRGSKGASLTTKGKTFFMKAPKVKEIQDTGAGDVFSGSLLFDLARREIINESDLASVSDSDIKTILQQACGVAAMVIQGFGVDYLNRHRSELSGNSPFHLS